VKGKETPPRAPACAAESAGRDGEQRTTKARRNEQPAALATKREQRAILIDTNLRMLVFETPNVQVDPRPQAQLETVR
jgi:hypothetical protein